jgi:hypothetical protein
MVVTAQCCAVIHCIVAENFPTSIELPAITYQQIPIMVPHFMPEMAEEGSVRFSHLQPALFSFNVIGFR